MDVGRARVASFLFFCQIMSLKMLRTWMRLDCILEHIVIKTLAQGKVKGRKLQKNRVPLVIVVNSAGIDKLKLLVSYTSKQPQCFERWQPHEYVW